VVFEPHAIVWARSRATSPGCGSSGCAGGAGNVQVTLRYRNTWFHRGKGKLGGISFALIWFSVFLMPALMVLSSASLVALFLLNRDVSLDAFRSLWALNLITYAFVTLSAFAQDTSAARRSWLEAVTFPGLISLAIIAATTVSPLLDGLPDWLLLFAYVWLSASMLAAYLVRKLEGIRGVGWLARPLLYVVGYGPLLCTITAAAYVAEMRHAEMRWEKTEKTGAVGDMA
jgi:hypothetical protein